MKRLRPVLRPVLRVLVPLALLGILWATVDGPAVIARLSQAKPEWVLAALLLVNAQTVLSAWRWSWVTMALGAPVAPGRAVQEYYLSQLVNQTLPGGVVGDAARAMRAGDGDLKRAAFAVVIERFAGQLALFAVLLVALSLSLLVPGGMAWPAGTGLVLIGVGCIGTALVAVFRRVRSQRATGFVVALRQAIFDPAWRLRQAGISGAIVLCNLGSFACAARATGSTLPVEAVLTLIPLILTAMLLPVSVAGWGWREGAAAAVFPLAGLSSEAGLAASVAFGIILLLASLPGIFPLLRGALPVTKPVAIRPEHPNSTKNNRRL